MNEPDIVQKLSVDFNVINDLAIDISSSQSMDVQFGSVYMVGGDCKVLYASTETWNSKPDLISEKGYIYIYSDYKQNDQGQNIAGFKVGDGNAYLIDLPFSDEALTNHINDTVVHITQAEREFWNDKVRCYIDADVSNDNLIFTTN